MAKGWKSNSIECRTGEAELPVNFFDYARARFFSSDSSICRTGFPRSIVASIASPPNGPAKSKRFRKLNATLFLLAFVLTPALSPRLCIFTLIQVLAVTSFLVGLLFFVEAFLTVKNQGSPPCQRYFNPSLQDALQLSRSHSGRSTLRSSGPFVRHPSLHQRLSVESLVVSSSSIGRSVDNLIFSYFGFIGYYVKTIYIADEIVFSLGYAFAFCSYLLSFIMWMQISLKMTSIEKTRGIPSKRFAFSCGLPSSFRSSPSSPLPPSSSSTPAAHMLL